MIFIYSITSPSRKVYVGQTNNIKKRFNNYINLNCKNQIKIYNSLLKYGPSLHIFDVIETCSFEQANIRERYWQEKLDCVEQGLNCVYVETTLHKKVLSLDIRQKMSRVKMGQRKGVKFTDLHKQRISEARKGIKPSALAISRGIASRLGHKWNNKKIYKYDLDGNFICEYQSTKDAARENNILYSSISNCLNGRSKRAGNFTWKFINI